MDVGGTSEIKQSFVVTPEQDKPEQVCCVTVTRLTATEVRQHVDAVV